MIPHVAWEEIKHREVEKSVWRPRTEGEMELGWSGYVPCSVGLQLPLKNGAHIPFLTVQSHLSGGGRTSPPPGTARDGSC